MKWPPADECLPPAWCPSGASGASPARADIATAAAGKARLLNECSANSDCNRADLRYHWLSQGRPGRDRKGQDGQLDARSTPSAAHEAEYHEQSIAFLEGLWGDGFLSPGGPQEVVRIVEGIDFHGKHVLDIGCGSGGITIHLAQNHPLASITGFDVEQPVIDAARKRAMKHRLGERVSFVRGEPGPLPFPDASFDIVFSKDALVHVPDKERLAADIFRVLRPGGRFAASDWMIGHDGEPSDDMRAYLAAEGLSFGMGSPARYRAAFAAAGFVEVETVDRNPWYRTRAREELARLKGPLFQELSLKVGVPYVNKNIATWTAMLNVLDSGEHRPTHVFALKPDGGQGN